MDAKEIVHCALQIEKSIVDRSCGNIPTLLSDLEKSNITAEQLETTDIVKVLYRLLKSCSDDSVRKTTKSLLSKWKRQYSKETRGVKCEESKEPDHEAGDVGASKHEDSHSGSASTCDRTLEKPASSSVAKSDPQALCSTASSDFSAVRAKCAQLLCAALHPEPPDQDRAAELAGDIEQHIHDLHSSSQARYKACVRSKVANLRNPKSGHLHQGLLSGSLSPETFARMSADDMASAELRQLREQYTCEGVSERQLPQEPQGTQTRKIRCKRCGASDCRVTQVSRGALFLPAWVKQSGPDEDAMTFVTCSRCGQHWYHSAWVCL